MKKKTGISLEQKGLILENNEQGSSPRELSYLWKWLGYEKCKFRQIVAV